MKTAKVTVSMFMKFESCIVRGFQTDGNIELWYFPNNGGTAHFVETYYNILELGSFEFMNSIANDESIKSKIEQLEEAEVETFAMLN